MIPEPGARTSARAAGNASPARTARAYAKINLGLQILETRPDGFHELRTIYQTIAVHDTLTFSPGEGPLAIECAVPGVPLDDNNLVWRACAGAWCEAGRSGDPAGLTIRIIKDIPPRSGLGGGSADAALTLVTVNDLWELRLDRSRLLRIAADLGSDVPFFLTGGTAEGTGRGERIRALPDLPPCSVVLALPDFGVPTADAYRWLDEERGSATGADRSEPILMTDSMQGQVMNDLEEVVARRHPEILRMKALLLEGGASRALLSGSGSAVAGLFDAERPAAAAAAALESAGWRAIVTRTLARHEYGLESGLSSIPR